MLICIGDGIRDSLINMHWLFLIIAAIFEIGWPLGFTLSGTQPERFWAWISFAIISMTLSGVF